MESVLAQTFGDVEYLIIDDGSTDESAKVLREYEERDPRIRLTVRGNKGLTVTLNEALEQARGEFVARMDCDDISRPDRFEKQLSAMRADPSLVCVGGSFELIDEKGRLLTRLRPPTDDATIQKLLLAGHTAICHPAAIIRRDALTRVGNYDPYFKTTQDLDLWLRLGEVGRLGNVTEVVLQFRQHESSVSETKREEQRRYGREACERAWKRRGITDGKFEAAEPWRPGRDRASRHAFALRYGWWGFNSGARNTAVVYGAKAVGIAPWKLEGWKLLASALVKPMQGADDALAETPAPNGRQTLAHANRGESEKAGAKTAGAPNE
jgi:glycosyltransferase involved in cell wall biosynthesis